MGRSAGLYGDSAGHILGIDGGARRYHDCGGTRAAHTLSGVAEGDRDGWYYCYESLLSDAEYSAAKGSVLNAHYTSKEIIDGIYSALQRFGVKGNNRILEPALGTGNFFGYMPQEIAAGANLYGVELDTVI